MPYSPYSRSRSRSRGRFDDGRNRYSYYNNHRSRTRSRSRSRSHGGGGGGSGGFHDEDMCRLHVADLTPTIGDVELERAFAKFGRVREVWTAKNPPCFGFVVFETREQAALALREMDQRPLGDSRIKVTVAKPRNQRRKPFDPNSRCYQCGQRGHFSRDCDFYSNGGGGRHHRGRSRSRSRGGGREQRHYSSRSRYSRGRSYSPRER